MIPTDLTILLDGDLVMQWRLTDLSQEEKEELKEGVYQSIETMRPVIERIRGRVKGKL